MTQDRWTAVVCLAIAVFVALAIPSQTSDAPLPGARGFDLLDGAFFPKLAVVIFIVAAVWLFIEARPRTADGADAAAPPVGPAEAAAAQSEAETPADDEPPGLTGGDLLKSIALCAGMLVYVQFLEPVGYLVATIVGVSILAFVCGQRSWIGAFFGGVAFPAAIYYLFLDLFMVPLPRGDLWLGL